MTRPKKPDGQKAIKQSVSFDPEQMERIKKYCSREERSVSWCVRKAMDQWLEDKGVQHSLIFLVCFGSNGIKDCTLQFANSGTFSSI